MAKKKKKSLWQRAKAWFKETFTPHKENKKVSNNTSFGRAVNRIQQKAQAGYERTYGSSGSTTRQAQGQRTSAPSSVSARKAETKAKSNSWKPEKKISVAEVMKAQIKPTESTFDKATKKAKEKSEKKSDLTAREQALKKRVQQATHVVGNRVGKDFAKDARSGIYNVKATKKEKANVAKSIEKDYNKKSGKQKFVAGLTKSDANVRIATKAITGKNIKTNKVTKSKAYKAGDITQEMASYAIAPTGAVEKGLGKAAVKAGAKKLLKAEGKKATKEAVAKVSETVAKDLAKNKVRTFARKRAADTIANAGFNAKYAASRARDENGKVDKKEAVKDFAINTGLDIGIGSGLDIAKGIKTARKAKKTTALVPQNIAKIEKNETKKEGQKLLTSKETKALPKKEKQKLLASRKLKALPEPKKQGFQGLTAEEEKQVKRSIRERAADKRAKRQAQKEYERADRAYNKERNPLDKFDVEERDTDLSRDDKKRFGKTVKEDYEDRLNLAKSKAKTKTARERADKAVRKTSRNFGIKNGVTVDQNPELQKAINAYRRSGDDEALYREVRNQMEDAIGGRKKRFIRNYDGRTKAGRKAKAEGKKKFSIDYEERTYRDLGATDKDLDRLSESYVDQVKKDLAKAEPKAGKKIKPKKWRSRLAETDKVYDESSSRQEVATLFGENQKQPKGKKVEGKLPERIKNKIDAKAEAKELEISDDDMYDAIAEWAENDIKAKKTPKAEAKAEPKVEAKAEETPKPKAESPIEPEGTAAQAEAESYGYHAGDLGKAEYARIQSGDRGTGHFGTGTYFVGDQNLLTRKGSGYANRPIHKINFSKYKLFKPKDNRAGLNVHSSLKELDAYARDMDGLLKEMTLDERKVDDVLYRLYQAEDAGDYGKYKEIADEVLTKSDYEAIDYDAVDRLETWKKYGVEDATKERAWRAEVGDKIEKKLKDLEYGNDYENFIPDLARDLGRSQDEVTKALENTRDILNKYPESAFDLGGKEKYDSAATVFMKELGYEGVDVRGLDALDDTRYGSVIYDLHPEDLPKVEEAVPEALPEALPEKVKKQIDRKAEQTAQEPTSTITAEETAKSTNTPTTEESTLKSSETRFEDIPNFYEEDARALEEKASEAEATLRKNAEAEDAEKAMQGAEEYDPIKDMVDTMAKREPGIHLPGSFEEPERAKAVLDGRRARAEETAQAEADFVDAATQQYKEGEKEAARQASKERTAKMDEHLRGEKTEATKAEAPETTEAPKEKSDPIKDKIGRPEKRSLEAKVNQFLTDARRKLINSLGFSERYAEKLANEGKMPKEFADTFRGNANNLRQATQRAKNSFADMQQDFNGNEVGESFMTIARDTASKGKEHYSNTEKYCFLLTHADRMDLAASKELDNLMGEYRKIEKAIEGKKIKKEKGEELLEELRQRMDEIEEVGLEDSRANKRVFDNLTADEARAEAQRILDADPEVAKDAERIFNYFRNDLMSQVQAGLISEDTFRFYLDKMPNYVPAHRAFERAGYSIGGDATKLRPDELVAKGSGRVVLPIEDQALLSAEYTFTRGAQNEVAKQIAEMSGYSPRLLDAFDDTDGVNALDLAMFYDFDRGTLQFWDKGKMRSVDVDKNFLKDLQDMQVTSVQAEALNATLQALGKGNRVFKSLITNFNPAFAVKNGIRDWPEGAFQSQDMMKYLKNYVSGKAAASILTNDEWYRAFKRMGVQNAQLVNNAEDIFKDENWFKKNTIGRVADMNEFVETLPRLSEFISFLEKRGKTPTTATADEMRQAGEAAADVTVNFGRSGSIGRIINSSLIPFFNPAMQGWSKIARVMTKDKSVKGYLNLIAKAGALGVAPAALNEILLADNENYQLINERDRAVNYYIPLDADNPLNKLFGSKKNGTKDGEVFLKIPKARFLSVMGMGTQKALGTTDIPWGDIVSISSDQIGPVGWSNNIFQQIKNSEIYNKDGKGKTWYGADIETDYDQQKLPKDRYDANTSSIAINLGKLTGKSPKKIDYLIDSYTGVVGDIAIPRTRKATGRSWLAKNFSTDTVSQNNLTTKMYDRINKLTQQKNSGDTSGKTEYGLWYLNKQSKDASEIRKQIREIQDSDKSKNQKAKEIRPLQRKLNKVTKTGMDTEKGFVKEAKKRIANLKDTDLSKENQKKYGLENAMIATAEKRGEDPWKIVDKAFSQAKNRRKMSPYAKKAGMDPVKFKEFYNIKAYDYDKSGRASKAELISYLNSRDDLTAQEKAILFAGTNKLFVKWGGNPFGDVGGGGNTKTAKAGGRRRYGRRRYGRRRYGRRGYSSKKASGGTPQKAPAKLKQTQAEKVSVASVMKTASAPSGTAQQKLIRSTTGNNAYTNAVKSVKSKKARKDIYKIKASKA